MKEAQMNEKRGRFKREKKIPREEMQREWRTLERGRVGKIGVGENRGRWVLAALWRAPGVAPRRFGASNAETLRWCWLHIPTHFNPRCRTLPRYSRTRNYVAAMTVRDSISHMYRCIFLPLPWPFSFTFTPSLFVFFFSSCLYCPVLYVRERWETRRKVREKHRGQRWNKFWIL